MTCILQDTSPRGRPPEYGGDHSDECIGGSRRFPRSVGESIRSAPRGDHFLYASVGLVAPWVHLRREIAWGSHSSWRVNGKYLVPPNSIESMQRGRMMARKDCCDVERFGLQRINPHEDLRDILFRLQHATDWNVGKLTPQNRGKDPRGQRESLPAALFVIFIVGPVYNKITSSNRDVSSRCPT